MFELLDAWIDPIHEPSALPTQPLLLWDGRSHGKPLENQCPPKMRNNKKLGCLRTLQGKLELLLRMVWLHIHEINYMSGVAELRSRDKKPSGRFSLLIITSLLKKSIKTHYGEQAVILKSKLQKTQEIKKCNEYSTLCSLRLN